MARFLALAKYAEDQPRDDHGRWSKGSVLYGYDPETGRLVAQIEPHPKRAKTWTVYYPSRGWAAEDWKQHGSGHPVDQIKAHLDGLRHGKPPLEWTKEPRKEKLAKYSDDQPRDDHGRWTSDGGGEFAWGGLDGDAAQGVWWEQKAVDLDGIVYTADQFKFADIFDSDINLVTHHLIAYAANKGDRPPYGFLPGYIGWDGKFYSQPKMDDLIADYHEKYGWPDEHARINFSHPRSSVASFHEKVEKFEADILNRLDLDGWVALANPTAKLLREIAAAAGAKALLQVGVDDPNVLDQVDEAALDFARARAAELVGKKWVDGELIDNPDAEWAITEATRDMLRGTVTQAVEEGWSPGELQAAIRDDYAFSHERAGMIADTELAHAHEAGNLEGWRASGVVSQVEWLAEDDACEDCLSNEADGAVGIDEAFSSGDTRPPAHPACRCSLVAVTDEVEEIFKYSDDQPRDDHGRWTDGGGSDYARAAAETGKDRASTFPGDRKMPWEMKSQAEYEALPVVYRGERENSSRSGFYFVTQDRTTAGWHGAVKEYRVLGGSKLYPDPEIEGEQAKDLSGHESLALGSAVIHSDDLVPNFSWSAWRKEKLAKADSRRRVARVLLLDDDQLWLTAPLDEPYVILPGGGIEAGESDEQAAIREAKEETGLDVEIIGDLGQLDDEHATRRYFVARRTGGEPAVIDQDGGRLTRTWRVPFDEALRLLTSPHDVAAVRQYLESVKKYNEDQPRDERGRWTSGTNPTVVYHGTSDVAARKIFDEGLKVGKALAGTGVFAATDKDSALSWGAGTAYNLDPAGSATEVALVVIKDPIKAGFRVQSWDKKTFIAKTHVNAKFIDRIEFYKNSVFGLRDLNKARPYKTLRKAESNNGEIYVPIIITRMLEGPQGLGA